MIGLPKPKTWNESPLGEVAEIERASVTAQNIETGTKYVGLEHLDSEGRILAVQTVNNGDLASNKFAFGPKHILYGKLRPYLRKIVRPDFDGVCSTDILPIRATTVDRGYLFHYLRHPRVVEYATGRCEGANLPRISPSELEKFPVQFPPSLPEQRRIADILDKADAIRRKRQKAIDVISSCFKSFFTSMFGDPVENLRGFPVETIANVATRISKGESPKWQGFDYQDEGIQFITSENVRWGHLDTTSPKFIPHEFHTQLERSQLAKDDLLINLVGASVGRAALVPDSELPANVNQAVAVVSLDQKRVLPSFLLHQLLNDRMQRVLLGNVVESARANISLTNIRETRIIVPDINDQAAWNQVVHRIANLLDFAKHAAAESNGLFNSLVQRAFRGEL